jgi:integration host factor subunit alpha
MSLTKTRLVESVLKLDFMSKTQAARTVETLFEIIKRELEKGNDVLISRFGKFYIKKKVERRGRNPQTGEDMMLPARKVVRFQCSSVLKKKLNERQERVLHRIKKKR